MKEWVVVVVLFLAGNVVFSQTPDTITILHKYYSTTFDRTKHYPVLVKFWLTKEMYSCNTKTKRTNKFTPDPAIPSETNLKQDYKGSGYDRGHNMPAEDNCCDATGMKECFYFSNMTPQVHSLNAGAWETLEKYARYKAKVYDSVLVWCGSVSLSDNTIGRVSVPDYCWKIISIKKLGITEAYSFKNDGSPSQPLESYRVSMDSVYYLSGFRYE
jgi:endonuclease G, mitochondrial